jgi:predicted transcriptional regulator
MGIAAPSDGAAGMTEKERILNLIQQLPDSVTTDDVMHELYVKAVLDRSGADEAAGRVVPHEEVKKRFSRWLEK